MHAQQQGPRRGLLQSIMPAFLVLAALQEERPVRMVKVAVTAMSV